MLRQTTQKITALYPRLSHEDELQALCNDCFPTDEAFYEKAKDMNKTLMQLDGKDFPQAEFAYYIQRCPFSTKTYAGDFMQEIYDLFIRDIVTTAERRIWRQNIRRSLI